MGYKVLFVSETATELISGGVAPNTCGTTDEFQRLLMKLQLEKERIFESAARGMGAEKVLIVCDRGVLDSKAYMSDGAFAEAAAELGSSEVELRDGYGAVFHLVTAAIGAREYYSNENNKARAETDEEAAELDRRLINVWTGHPHLRIIDNSADFSNKISRLIEEIASFLGEPEPFEIERKYLIEYPDVEWLESCPFCKRVEIVQTYLCSGPDEELRVRRRGADGHYVYFMTSKRKLSNLKRIETERRLSKMEYELLLTNADKSKCPIEKTRYCLVYRNQYLEIDLYPFWKDKAIAEIELRDESQSVELPEQITIIKEVTDDDSYKNVSLAKLMMEYNKQKNG